VRRYFEWRGLLRDRSERVRDGRQAFARHRGAKEKQGQMEIRPRDPSYTVPSETVLSDILFGRAQTLDQCGDRIFDCGVEPQRDKRAHTFG
jgi:hypothetical protein